MLSLQKIKIEIDPDSYWKQYWSGDRYQRIENANVIKFESFKS